VVERISIIMNLTMFEVFVSAKVGALHDAFMAICLRTLVLDKRMASNLLKKEKGLAKAEELRS